MKRMRAGHRDGKGMALPGVSKEPPRPLGKVDCQGTFSHGADGATYREDRSRADRRETAVVDGETGRLSARERFSVGAMAATIERWCETLLTGGGN